ncbi:MAG: protein kinase [Reyranella sp.]|nr:protein kinase [Reyranella sp.]MDP3158698.1 protein kinase [Reyranella sp.]
MPTSSENDQALPLGTRLGDYRLDAIIGHGGFGITYRAFDTQLAKFVAIKEYFPVEFAVRRPDGEVGARGTRFTDDFVWGRERFLDEARALARFRHVHIVPVLRYFEANGTAYTVMEFEDGRSVAQLLRAPNRRLQPDEVRRLAEGLLSGLRAVHAQGFLHRDIKPSNIIVRHDGVPILIDFGAARQAMGGRTRTLTSILTPQYAPIEQYALDGKQGPWTDIYSAAAVLHHAVAGSPPPEAVSRVGVDPYRPLSVTQADRFDQTLLAAIDSGLAFAPEQRPQTVADWSAQFGAALPQVDDALTQRLPGASTAPRLSGVSREHLEPVSTASPPERPRSKAGVWMVVVLIAAAAVALWRYQPEIRGLLAGTAPSSSTVATPTVAETPSPPAETQPPAAVPAAPATSPPAVPDQSARKTLIDQAQRAATEARALLDRADEASKAARAMAGEARIVAARAARPDLENAERLSYDGGASYVGQAAAGKRQGLGVAELANGERQAGDWDADRLNGLGIVRLGDDSRYAGQWNDGQSTGLGVREKPDVERTEGNFVAGRLEGLGVRRTLTEPNVVQSGEFHADMLEGPGVEVIGTRERYEGGFRASRRQGYGQVTGADGKMRSGLWEDGKLVDSTP